MSARLARRAHPPDTPRRTATFADRRFARSREGSTWGRRRSGRRCGWAGGKVYLNAGKIIGYLGCSKAAFEGAAGKLPDYDKFPLRVRRRDLTVWQKREEEGRYELH